MYLIGQRQGDAAVMAIVELVERKPKAEPVKEDNKKYFKTSLIQKSFRFLKLFAL
jgi:hypothetical protein